MVAFAQTTYFIAGKMSKRFLTLDNMINYTKKELFKAKENGKNRIEGNYNLNK